MRHLHRCRPPMREPLSRGKVSHLPHPLCRGVTTPTSTSHRTSTPKKLKRWKRPSGGRRRGQMHRQQVCHINSFAFAMNIAQLRSNAIQCTIPEQICDASCNRPAEEEEEAEGQQESFEGSGCRRRACHPPPPPLGRCCACCFHQKTCHANAPPLTEFCMHCATGEDAHPTCVEPRMFKTARLSEARGDTIKLDTENGVWLFCEWEWFTGDL